MKTLHHQRKSDLVNFVEVAIALVTPNFPDAQLRSHTSYTSEPNKQIPDIGLDKFIPDMARSCVIYYYMFHSQWHHKTAIVWHTDLNSVYSSRLIFCVKTMIKTKNNLNGLCTIKGEVKFRWVRESTCDCERSGYPIAVAISETIEKIAYMGWSKQSPIWGWPMQLECLLDCGSLRNITWLICYDFK